MAIVTKTIGSDSRDYSTITLWEADLDDTGIYSSGDDAVGELYDDTTFNESVAIDGGGVVGLSSIKLTSPVGQRHDGTAGTGARIVLTADPSGDSIDTTSTAAPTTIEFLEIDWAGFIPSTNRNAAGIISDGATQKILESVIVHGLNGSGQTDTFGFSGFSGNSAVLDCINCAAYALEKGGASGKSIAGFAAVHTGVREINLHYCVSHDISKTSGSTAEGFVLGDGGVKAIQNCISTDSDDGDFVPASPSTITMDHNLSSDTSASGTGRIISKPAANQFVSVTVGMEDLHLKSGADALGGGTPISGITTDVDGDTRDVSTPDMGFDEFVAAGGTILPQMMMTGMGV